MRKYTPKDNVQGKSYYNNRFWSAPRVPRQTVAEDEYFSGLLEVIKKSIEPKEAYVELGQMIVHIDPKDNFETLKLLKEQCDYAMCSEITAVDYLAKDGEFEVLYQMLNLKKAKRVRIVTRIRQDQAIESVVPLYNSANFAEREMFDMFGIIANNHPMLKRILMPEDWEGHPLLKTYPLQGDDAAAWYEVDKIFGKEYRDIIGPENRDPAKIDRYDSKRFSRVGYEVPFDADVSEEAKKKPIEYSDTLFVDYNKSSKQLDERR